MTLITELITAERHLDTINDFIDRDDHDCLAYYELDDLHIYGDDMSPREILDRALQTALNDVSAIVERAANTPMLHTLLAKLAPRIVDTSLDTQNICASIALCGNLDNLKLATEVYGCHMTDQTCANAALNGHLEMLKWARLNGCIWNADVCANAALNGHLDVLQWARNENPPCPWTVNTCANAALNGHLEVLQWARTQRPKCPWTCDTCSNAAIGGHLHVLQWARAQQPACPWTATTCMNAVIFGHLEVLQWAVSNGCFVSCRVRTCAAHTRNSAIIQCLHTTPH